MALKELYFPSALTIGLGPGEAVEVRAGEVLAVPGEIVKTLLKRQGVVEAGANHSEARRITLDERRLPPEKAVMASPPLDEDRLLADHARRKAAAALRAEMENLGGKSAKS